jgi:hypothetical protein
MNEHYYTSEPATIFEVIASVLQYRCTLTQHCQRCTRIACAYVSQQCVFATACALQRRRVEDTSIVAYMQTQLCKNVIPFDCCQPTAIYSARSGIQPATGTGNQYLQLDAYMVRGRLCLSIAGYPLIVSTNQSVHAKSARVVLSLV